jgi:hypothetical protein
VGRHELARKRRKSPLILCGGFAAGAVFFATGGDVHPFVADGDTGDVQPSASACCAQIVAVGPTAFSLAAPADQAQAASRFRIVEPPRLLPAGVAPERGLQVDTILAARSISAVFPEIHNIGGVRPDALRWHPNGLALDVMIPNPSSAEGIALGNEIAAYALKNAARFSLQDVIWRGTYYTPSGPQGSGYGHFDHVHITTTGGGYPTGGELYYR